MSWPGVPEPGCTGEWELSAFLASMSLSHLFDDFDKAQISFKVLKRMKSPEIKAIVPGEPADIVRIHRRLKQLHRSKRDAQTFRTKGIRLGKRGASSGFGEPGSDNSTQSRGDLPLNLRATYSSNLTIQRKKAPQLGANGSNFLSMFGLSADQALKDEGEKSGRRQRPKTIVLQKGEDSMKMDLDTETGKLILSSGTFSDVLDVATFYVNVSDKFLDYVVFTHRYWVGTEELLNGFRAQVDTARKALDDAAPEARPSAAKVVEQVQERMKDVIGLFLESHFYYFDNDKALLDSFFQFIRGCVADPVFVKGAMAHIDGTLVVRSHQSASRSQRTSVAFRSVINKLLIEDQSGLINDRRKGLRVHKDAFVAVEAIGLVMRKLKVKKRAAAVTLIDSLRESGDIKRCDGAGGPFKDGDVLWKFTPSEAVEISKHSFEVSFTSIEEINLLAVPALMLAEQLTLTEFDAFQKITPTEMSFQAWNKGKAPNVLKLIDNFNKMTFWVGTEVCVSKLESDRVAKLSRFIDIAAACREMHNYNTMMEIIVGLSMAPVSRLKKHWAQVSDARMKTFKSMSALVDQTKNYANYREAIKISPLPCFPYLGLSIKDLTFIEDGNETYLDEDSTVINFEKMMLIAGVFQVVQRYQQHPYELERNIHVCQFLEEGRTIIADDKELYKYSQAAEPRAK